jgi:hypothetical protein
MWMGGWAPLGYDVKDRKLIINEVEAAKVRWIFERFVKVRSAKTVAEELAASGFINKYGHSLDKGRVYKLLRNRVYVGEAVHKGESYPGEHEPIVSRDLWEKAQAVFAEPSRVRAGRQRAQSPAILKGLIFDDVGRAMSPTHTRRGQKLYRYYLSQKLLKEGKEASKIGRVPAAEIEAAVIAQLRALLLSPEIIVATWQSARRSLPDFSEGNVRSALEQFDDLWDELFPAEQARIVQLLVERVDVDPDGLQIRLRVDGLTQLFHEMQPVADARQAA